MHLGFHMPLSVVTVLVLFCGFGLDTGEAAASTCPVQPSGELARDDIDDARTQILELEKDIAAKQAKWDKLHAEYLRIMNVTGGRLNSTAQTKVARLDADARKIKADIDAQKAVLAATHQHLERLEMARAREQEAREAQRNRQSRPSPPRGDDEQNREGDSSGLEDDPSLARKLPRVLLVDLSDPVGAGGACTAKYFVERLGSDGVDVAEGLSFTVSFDWSGFPVKVPGYREYRESARGGVEVLDGELEQMVRLASSDAIAIDGTSTLRVDRILGQDWRESGSKFRFGRGPLGLRLESVDFESRRLMFEYDLIGASLPPLWQQVGSAEGTDRLAFDYYPSGRIAGVRWDMKSISYSYGSEGRLEGLELRESEAPLLRIDFDGWDEVGRWVSARCLAVDSVGHERPTVQLRRVFDGEPEGTSFLRREFNLLEGPIVVRALPTAESPRLIQAAQPRDEQDESHSRTQQGDEQAPTTDTAAGERETQPSLADRPIDDGPQSSREGRAGGDSSDATNLGAWITFACLYAIVSAIVGWRVTPTWTYGWIASSMMSARGFVQSTGIGQAKGGAVGMSDEQAELRAQLLEFGVRLLVAMLFGSLLMLVWLARWYWRGLSRTDGRL